jgi:RsiW-degrading membrane proteinase PrsW (M82 family)
MPVVRIAAAIIAPAVFWVGYYYYKDRRRPEPLLRLLQAYFLGLAFGFLCYLFYQLRPLPGFSETFTAALKGSRKFQSLIYAVAGVGLVEEVFKFLPFAVVFLKAKCFDEKIDGVVYSSAIAIGFASFENIGYLPAMKGFAFIGRALASPLTHTIFSSIWGYTVGTTKMAGRPIWKAAVVGVGLAAIAHGIYNFLTVSPTLRILSALLILGIWIWLIRFLERPERPMPSSAR